MPNRVISEKCRTSPTLAALSSDAERLWWRMTTIVDDYGRFEAVPLLINGSCVPLLKWKDAKVMKCLEEFAIERAPDKKPLVIYYYVKCRLYGQISTFLDHQRKRESKPKFPAPKDGTRIMPPLLAASCGELPPVAAYPNPISENENVSESDPARKRRERGVPQMIQKGRGEECPPELLDRFKKIGKGMPS